MRFLVVSDNAEWGRACADELESGGARAARARERDVIRSLSPGPVSGDAKGTVLAEALASSCVAVLLDGERPLECCQALSAAGANAVAFAPIQPGNLAEYPCPVFSGPLAEPAEAARVARELGRIRKLASREEASSAERVMRKRAARLGQAIAELRRRRRGIYKEMNLAVELQKSLLPKDYPDLEGLSFTHRYIPMASVGGDFFDVVRLSDSRAGIFISDVSGHGIAPAFITAMIKSQFDWLRRGDPPPSALIRSINREYSRIIETDHFVTAFYCVLDLERMRCDWCGAGHPAQLRVPADGPTAALESCNPVIGMLPDFEFAERTVALEPGDLFCFHTDGIIESRAADGSLFGRDGLDASLRGTLERDGLATLDELANGVVTDLIGYMKDPYFEDDITLLLARLPAGDR